MADYTRIINEGLYDSNLLTSGGENFMVGGVQFVVTRGGEQITFADSMSSVIDELNALQETITHSDVINRLQLDKVFAETLSASESLLSTLGRDSSDSAGFQDSISTILDRVRALSDNIIHSDSLVKQVQVELSDSFSTADALQKELSWLRTQSDTLATSESISKIYTWIKTLSDAVTLADTIARNIDYIKTFSETPTFSDSIGIRDLTIILTDTLQAQEQLAKLVTIIRTDDTLTFLDSITESFARAQLLSESIGLSDLFEFGTGGSLADTITFADSTFNLYDWVKTFSDTVNMSDSIEFTLDLIKSDSLVSSESISKILTRIEALSDQLNFADSTSLTFDHVRTLSDTTSFSETFAKDIIIALNDTLNVAESILATLMRPLSESITLTDSYARSFGIVKNISDTVQFTDTGGDVRSILRTPTGESITLDDSVAVQIALIFLDSFDVSESLDTIALRTLAQSEGITLSDSVAKTVIHRYNSVAFIKDGNPYSDLVTGKARKVPSGRPFIPRQISHKASGGTVQVCTLGIADELFQIELDGLNETQKTNLLGFLAHSTVNYGEKKFTFVEEGTGLGTSEGTHTVRLWKARGFNTPRVKGGLYNVRLTLRKEVEI